MMIIMIIMIVMVITIIIIIATIITIAKSAYLGSFVRLMLDDDREAL